MSKSVAWQVVSLMKNEQRSQNLLLKVHPRSTFRNNFLQPVTNVFVARQVDHQGEKRETSTQNLQRNNVAWQVEGFRISYFAALLRTVYMLKWVFLRKEMLHPKKDRCHVTLQPPHNGHLSTTATFHCSKGGRCSARLLSKEIFKVQLTPKILFRLFESPHFSDHHCEKIIVVAIFVNFLCIFEVRKISPFRGHDRAIANNGASWLVTSSKDLMFCF